MSNIIVKHYINYDFPGILFPESSARVIKTRNETKIPRSIPEGCFAYNFFDRTETKTPDGEILLGKKKNFSTRFYVDPKEVHTLQSLKQKYGKKEIYRTLISNVEINKYSSVILCNTNNWQPLKDGDHLVYTESKEIRKFNKKTNDFTVVKKGKV